MKELIVKTLIRLLAIGLISGACHENEIVPYEKDWHQISSWGQNSYVRCIAVRGSTIFAGTDLEIYRSTNNGNTWTKLPPYSQQLLDGLRSILIHDNMLLGGEPAEGFIKSTDNGLSWRKIQSIIPEREAIYSMASNLDYLFVGTADSGLFRSKDNGGSWEKVFETASVGEPIWNTAADGTNVLIFIPNKGLFLSQDNGENWTIISGDINVTTGSGAIYIKDQIIFLGTNKFYKSENLGLTWKELTKLDNGFEASSSSIISNDNVLYATSGGGISYSKDLGENWVKMTAIDNSFGMIYQLVSNDHYIFGFDEYNIYRVSKVK